MKLPKVTLNIGTKLREFDVWITPSLGEIRDTEQFRKELEAVVQTFERLGDATGKFASPEQCKPNEIADAFIKSANELAFPDASAYLGELASLLFLVTGKSDNNAKCQLPLYLRDQVKLNSFPSIVKAKGKKTTITTKDGQIPRELKTKRYMDVVAALKSAPHHQKVFLDYFINFLISDENYISQLWSIGHSYFALKTFNKERDFLRPLVVFKIRGSVAATGGHVPEILLRARLTEWGLQPDIDFNLGDVPVSVLEKLTNGKGVSGSEVAEEIGIKKKQKTRAYDFVLPFKTPGTHRRVCIQSQFYAGDSGGVSHKNIGQTASSRAVVRAFAPDVFFVEYVDGAGYFSTLNGDLERLLEMEGTEFFQVRSAPIRLRRELQHAGFLVPLEIQQATYRVNNSTPSNVTALLLNEGYTEAEIGRCLKDCLERGLLIEERKKIAPRPEDRDTVRRYLLLDVAAVKGEDHDTITEQSGLVMVPGYGPFHGIKGLDLIKETKALAPGFTNELDKSELILADLDWLKAQKLTL
jgi:hypothetical protein